MGFGAGEKQILRLCLGMTFFCGEALEHRI